MNDGYWVSGSVAVLRVRGLDLAVEHAFDADTVWFCENREPFAHVFAHHWPGAVNLGDITRVDGKTVPPVDILCEGFLCQDVSTVASRPLSHRSPGPASGRMAPAIDALQPEWVVIENVRGLQLLPAVWPQMEGATDARRNPGTATHGDATATLREVEPDRRFGNTSLPRASPALLKRHHQTEACAGVRGWLMGLEPGWGHVTDPTRPAHSPRTSRSPHWAIAWFQYRRRPLFDLQSYERHRTEFGPLNSVVRYS